MSDDENESAGGWVQAIIAFIKKLPLNLTRIAKGAVKGVITEMKEDTMKESAMDRSVETHIKCDVSLKSWQENNVKVIYHKSEKYRVKDEVEKEVKNLSPEWGASFIDKSKNISDEDMQIILAKILAGERDNPGTFSKRTLSVVDNMDKEDLKLFIAFCQFVWLAGKRPLSIIYDVGTIHDAENSIYGQKGIMFSTLQHLESIGLIFFRSSWQYYQTAQPAIWCYYGTVVFLSPKNYPQKNDYYIDGGKVLLTQSGKELFRILDVQKNDKFFSYVINKWKEDGYNPVIQNPETVNTTE